MGGKFVVRAGQHKFESGEKVVHELPILPSSELDLDKKSMRLDLSQLASVSDFSQSKYRVYKNNGSFNEGVLDSNGRTHRIFTSDSEELDVFIDHPDFVVDEEFFIEPNDDQEG
jgi:type VI secretion system secreted protein VgrG